MSESVQVLPGEWIGVLGGGQLGRMFTHAAQRLGYHVAVYEPDEHCPAGQAADRLFSDEPGNDSAILEMAQLCAAITLEFENVDAEIVRKAGRFAMTHPGADFLEICQDRVKEKSSLRQAGLPVTPFMAVESVTDVQRAADELGWPLILKTATSGYDGKGQAVVRDIESVEGTLRTLGSSQLIAEKMISFDAEVSMIAARNRSGQIESYPLLENDHANHILDVTRCPVSSPLREYESQAQEVCRGIAESFGVVGLFCVEFFVTQDGELLINEIAPRPHNSGHLTIEGFQCSQFEQQVRAICNLPLLQPEAIQAAAMVNLLGDVWSDGEPQWANVLAHSRAHLHLYGKAAPRVGRKMGHITVLDESSSEAAITAKQLREALAICQNM